MDAWKIVKVSVFSRKKPSPNSEKTRNPIVYATARFIWTRRMIRASSGPSRFVIARKRAHFAERLLLSEKIDL